MSKNKKPSQPRTVEKATALKPNHFDKVLLFIIYVNSLLPGLQFTLAYNSLVAPVFPESILFKKKLNQSLGNSIFHKRGGSFKSKFLNHAAAVGFNGADTDL